MGGPLRSYDEQVTDGSDQRRPALPSEDARAIFAISPFTRLARAHVFSTAGDALFAIGLAGTVFFDVELDSARWEVALTLLLTIAPFAVAAPLIGPSLDRLRGGRRWMIVGTQAGRAITCLLLVQQLDHLAFYPLAFLMLVFGKSYQIAKSAIVPTTVRNDAELVEANSKLSLIGGLSVAAAAIPGGIFWQLGGSDWVVGFAAVVFTVGAIVSTRVPATLVAEDPVDDAERNELRGIGILLAASAMGLLRGIVGFLAFLLAFNFKGDGIWKLAVVAVAAQAGFLAGAALAPRLRKIAGEERILIGVLITLVVTSTGAAFTGGLFVASLMSFTVGAGSSVGKQAFDAIVQRDAPDANRGRSFARFETRFQLLWVIGALIPVVTDIPTAPGFAVMAAVAGFSAVSYWMGLRSASMQATEIVRRQARQARRVGEENADEVLARHLGFESAASTQGRVRREQPGPEAPDLPATREAGGGQQALDFDPESVDGIAAAEADDDGAPTGDDSDGPDLDWHPEG